MPARCQRTLGELLCAVFGRGFPFFFLRDTGDCKNNVNVLFLNYRGDFAVVYFFCKLIKNYPIFKLAEHRYSREITRGKIFIFVDNLRQIYVKFTANLRQIIQ